MVDHVIHQVGLQALTGATKLEVTKRVTKDGKPLYFVLNMGNKGQNLPKELTGYHDLLTGQLAAHRLEGWDVEILTPGMDN